MYVTLVVTGTCVCRTTAIFYRVPAASRIVVQAVNQSWLVEFGQSLLSLFIEHICVYVLVHPNGLAHTLESFLSRFKSDRIVFLDGDGFT